MKLSYLVLKVVIVIWTFEKKDTIFTHIETYTRKKKDDIKLWTSGHDDSDWSIMYCCVLLNAYFNIKNY